jgi:hypothetical protein
MFSPQESMITQLKSLIRKSATLERIARAVVDRRYQLAKKHLRGNGLEIGALDRPLLLPSRATAYYLDHLLPSQLHEQYPELQGRKVYVSLVAEGEELACIKDASLDFIIANHVIEHCENPIATLMTFQQKLKPSGVIFMAVPDMRKTFDHRRTETTWEHVWTDYQTSPLGSRSGHYLEWSTMVEEKNGEQAQTRAEELMTMRYSIHFHCWTESGFRNFLMSVGELTPLHIVDSVAWRNENIFILRKERR